MIHLASLGCDSCSSDQSYNCQILKVSPETLDSLVPLCWKWSASQSGDRYHASKAEVTSDSGEEDAEGDIDAAIAKIMSVLVCTAEEAREALIQSNMDHDAALGYVVKEWD